MKNKTLIIILCVISVIAILCAGVLGTLYFVNKSNSQNPNDSGASHSIKENSLNQSENTGNNIDNASENINPFKIGKSSVFAGGTHIYKEFHLDENKVDFILENQKKNVKKVIHTLYFPLNENGLKSYSEEDVHCDPFLCFNGNKLYWVEKDQTSDNAYLLCYDIANEQVEKVFKLENTSPKSVFVFFEDSENIYYTDNVYESIDDTSGMYYSNLSKYNKISGSKTIIEDRISLLYSLAFDQSPDFITNDGKLIYTSTDNVNSFLNVFDFTSEKSVKICESTSFYYHTDDRIFFFNIPNFFERFGNNYTLDGFTLYSYDLNGSDLREMCTFNSIPIQDFGSAPLTLDPTVHGTDDYFYFLGCEFDIKASSCKKIYDCSQGYTSTVDKNLYLTTFENGVLNTYELNNGFEKKVLLASENIADYYKNYTENGDFLIFSVASMYSFVQNDSLYVYRLSFDNEGNLTTAYIKDIPFNK